MNIEEQVIHEGLTQAADVLKSLLGNHIDSCFLQNTSGVVPETTKKENALHLIQTELMGGFKGANFLILGQTDVEAIFGQCLPFSVSSKDNVKNRKIKGGFLTELDSILSASAITSYANSGNINIYGDVPSLKVMSTDRVNALLLEEYKQYVHPLVVRVNFSCPELGASMEFIWFFERALAERIVNKNKLSTNVL